MSVVSPCVLVCVMDPRTGWCFGCGRTREEIGAWLSLKPAERLALMAHLPERMSKIERPPRRETKRRRLAAGAMPDEAR